MIGKPHITPAEVGLLLRLPALWADTYTPAIYGVLDIALLRDPFQIGNIIVCAIKIAVVYLRVTRFLAKEGVGHQSMNAMVLLVPAIKEGNQPVSPPIIECRQYFPFVGIPDATGRGDLILARVAPDMSPYFFAGGNR